MDDTNWTFKERRKNQMKTDLILGLGIGFFAGVLVGGVTALLLAPESGEELRGQIRVKAGEGGQYIKDTYGQASDWVVDQTGKLRKVKPGEEMLESV
jgi:gas vesicle protein